jgi:hypothetical protein
MRDVKGERLFKSVEIKIVPVAGEVAKRTFRANPGRRFSSDGIYELLEKVIEHIETNFPGQEFHLVPIGPAAFNFVGVAVPLQEATR